jgi:hypothetical protein
VLRKLEASPPGHADTSETIATRRGHAICRFAPLHHQAATVAGLSGTYSAEEIGAIYAASWERYFSQCHADIASTAIAWTAVKNHAARHAGLGAAGVAFQAAMRRLVKDDLFGLINGDSLGKYHAWEHMDAPSDQQARQAADESWAGKASGVAGYLTDSRAYIKDQMVAAIDVYRRLHDADAICGSIDNWHGTAGPAGYVHPTSRRSRSLGSVYLTIEHLGSLECNDAGVASRDPIKEQTSALVGERAAAPIEAFAVRTGRAYDAAQWEPVARHLGRAMHAFENFWAHTNWLELARVTYVHAKRGDTAPPLLQCWVAANQELETYDFDMPAKVRALGHQLLALARGFQRDFDLLLKVYGRTHASTKLDHEDARSVCHPGPGDDGEADRARVYGPLASGSWSAISELVDLFMAAHHVQALVRSGKYRVEDFLCNRTWLAALEAKSQELIQRGAMTRRSLGEHPDEADKDHRDRIAIASAANERVFGPLRAIMDEADPTRALTAVQAQLALIDAMIQAPSSSHPMWSCVVAAAETR